MATWDLENVVAAANNAALAGRPRAVLLSTGALNPPHRGHVKMIEQAKVSHSHASSCPLWPPICYVAPSPAESTASMPPSTSRQRHPLCRGLWLCHPARVPGWLTLLAAYFTKAVAASRTCWPPRLSIAIQKNNLILYMFSTLLPPLVTELLPPATRSRWRQSMASPSLAPS